MVSKGKILRKSSLIKFFNLIVFISIFLLAIYLFFWKLGDKPLVPYDEQLYRKILIDTINYSDANQSLPLTLREGVQPYFHTSPLWFWLAIVLVKLFGITNFTLRIISSLSGFLLVMLTFYIGLKYINFYGGLISMFILLTSKPLFFKYSYLLVHNFKSVEQDALFTLFVLLSFFFTLKAKKNIVYFYLATILSGAAFMIKGPSAIFPLFIFVIFNLINKNNNTKIHGNQIVLGLVIFLIVVLPWHMYQYLKFGNLFIEEYLGYHYFQRFFTPIENHRHGLFFYFFYLLYPQNYIWGILLYPILIVRTVFNYTSLTYFDFSLTFNILYILFFYTIAQTKMYWYISSIYPFIALLIASNFFFFYGNFKKIIRNEQ